MEKSYKKIKTTIEGLKIHLNKVVSDERGHFIDLAETDNPIFKDIKHLHASIATKKHVARGEHFHYKLKEDFYVLGGNVLFICHDFNKESTTFGETFAVILGDGKEKIETDLDSYYLNKGEIAQLEIQPMVYHAFWPLTDSPAVVFVSGNAGYDSEDYELPKINEVPGAIKILKNHKINIS